MICTPEDYKAALAAVDTKEIYYHNNYTEIFTHNNQLYHKNGSILEYWVYIDWINAHNNACKRIMRTIVNEC